MDSSAQVGCSRRTARRGSARGWLLLGLVVLVLAAFFHLRISIFAANLRFLVLVLVVMAAALWLLKPRRRP